MTTGPTHTGPAVLAPTGHPPVRSKPLSRLSADLLLVVAAVVWGLAFVYQKSAMAVIGPFTFIAARSVVAALALAPLAVIEARRAGQPLAPAPGLTRMAAVGGVLFFIAAAFQQIGLITASVTNSGFLTALYVVFVPFVAWAWHRLRPDPIVLPAAALSFLGTWLLGGGLLAAFGVGDAMVAISAVFWAAHVVITGAASRFARPVAFTCLQFAVVGLLGLAGAFAFETPTLDGLAAAWTEILYVGLLSSALTFTLLAVALKHTPPAEAAIIVSMESLFAAFAGAWLLGERLSWIAWSGAGLILTATLLVQLAPVRQRRRATEAMRRNE
jgi:drug/metabolite transporter (DMT)-like permease